MVENLRQLSEEKGVPKEKAIVDKNIIKSEKSTFDSDKKKKALSRVDKAVLVDAFSLFNKMFFDYQKTLKLPPPLPKEAKKTPLPLPKAVILNTPEADKPSSTEKRREWVDKFNLFNQMFFDYKKKIEPDTVEKTKVSNLAAKQTQPPVTKTYTKKDTGFGLMGMVVAGLTLLATSVTGIVSGLTGFFGEYSGVVKTVGKLGFLGALKILSKTVLKRFSLALLKRLPVIGGIIGLAYAVKAFKDGDIFLGVAELISGLLNFIPGVGPFLSLGADLLIGIAQANGVFSEGGSLSPENGWNTIKGWGKSLGKMIMDNALYIPIIGTFKRFGMAYDAFKSNNFGEGIKQIGLGLFTILPGGGAIIKGMEVLAGWVDSAKEPEGQFNKDNSWMGKIKKWIVSKLNNLPEFLKIPLRWFGVLDDDGPTSFSMTGIASSAKEGFDKVKNFTNGVWDNISGAIKNSTAGFEVGTFAKDSWNVIKEESGKAWDLVKEKAPGIWNSIKEESGKAWDAVKEETPKLWNSIKENTSKAWGFASEEAGKLWASVKETSSTVWGKLSEAGSWFADSVSEMANKTKGLIDEWIPKIVDSVSGMTDAALKTLKNIATKIGDWVGSMFSFGDDKKTEPKKDTESQTIVKGGDYDMQMLIVKNSITTNKWMTQLHAASLEQVKLLGMLVNVNNDSLKELKRISGNSSSGSNPIYISPPQQQSNSALVNMPNNRNGFGSSMYSLA